MAEHMINGNPTSEHIDGESLYRTRWLMAHNYLCDLAHEGNDPQAAFEGYLRELKTAESVASRPA